jgi:putative solute:sodium symporter small subunit
MLGWLAATLVMVFWPLAWDFDFWGWPFGFWLGAQGVLLVYWAIVALYAWVQSRADARWRELGTSEDKG